MTKNTGKPYERFTQEVFRAILAHEGVNNVDVQNDVELQGKTATHQIDVYWEFDQGGIRYRTVVQCKDWDSRVKQEQLFAFKTVLDDLPGQPRGVVVSRKGFQQGAREFAAAHGILIYELREPQDSDWDGYVREVHIEMQLLVPVLHAFQLIPDAEWARSEKQRLGLADTPIPIEFRCPLGELVFRREDGSVLTNAGDVVEKLAPGIAGQRIRTTHRFEESAFLEVEHETFHRIRILGLEVDVEQTVGFSQMIHVNANELVSFILKNVVDGSFRSLDAQGRPLGES